MTYFHYQDKQLLQIAMPMGGLGAGCICLNGYGGLQDFALHNRPATTALPDGHQENEAAFALLHIKGEPSVTKLIEGPFPPEKIYDQALQAQGYRHGGYEGLPRFETCAFEAGYPFGTVNLSDPDVPLGVAVTGWSPFIPGDDVHSGMPCALLEYHFENTSTQTVAFEFSTHLTHLAAGGHWADTRNSCLKPPSVGETGGGIAFFHDPSHGRRGLWERRPVCRRLDTAYQSHVAARRLVRWHFCPVAGGLHGPVLGK